MDYQKRVSKTYKNLATYFNPTRKLYKGQITNVAQEFDPERTMLEQARRNAYRDISSRANDAGVFFSGRPIEGQQEYTDTRYLPAFYDINRRQRTRKQGLEEALAKLDIEQNKSARSIVDEQLGLEQKALDRSDRARRREEDLLYRQARLNQSQQRINNSAVQKQLASEEKRRNQFKLTRNGNGYAFTGPRGVPINMAEYLSGSGGDVNVLKQLLRDGSAYDKKIYNSVQLQLRNKKIKNSPEAVLEAIARQDAGNYYGLRG